MSCSPIKPSCSEFECFSFIIEKSSTAAKPAIAVSVKPAFVLFTLLVIAREEALIKIKIKNTYIKIFWIFFNNKVFNSTCMSK